MVALHSKLIAPYCLKQLGHQLLLSVKISCDPFPNVLSSHYFQNGQVLIPDKCVNPSELTEKEHRLAFSLDSDLFDITKGHVKPAKQLVIGLGMKSITGSEKLCKILHKFRHAISC